MKAVVVTGIVLGVLFGLAGIIVLSLYLAGVILRKPKAVVETNVSTTTATPEATPTPVPGRSVVRLVVNQPVGLAEAGWSLATSASGDRIAVGGPFADGGGSVWIFDRASPKDLWSQVRRLENDTLQAYMGGAVGLSADGTLLAVGYGMTDGCLLRLFRESNGVWAQHGTGVAPGVMAPISIPSNMLALSGDGSTVAFGNYYDNNPGGKFWVYAIARDGTLTEQLSGTNIGLNSGYDLALSHDGNVLAVGAVSVSRIYRRNEGGVWVQEVDLEPSDIVLSASGMPRSVSLSADGHTCAVGIMNYIPINEVTAPLGSGTAVVWRYNGTGWVQDPGPVRNPNQISFQGNRVSLSRDGQTMLVGAYQHRAIPDESEIPHPISGAAYVFAWNGSQWVQDPLELVGGDITNLNRGWSLASNQDGSVLCVGSVNGWHGTPASVGATFVWYT